MIDYEQIESSQRQHDNNMEHIQRMDNEHELHCLRVVQSLGLAPRKDGNQWCYLYGENLQEGISGFGDTIILACMDFYENLNKGTCNQHKEATDD